MVRWRILLFLVSLILVPTLSYFVILFARGYRFQRTPTQIVTPTGLLVANSNPDGAQLYVNTQLKSATNTTFSLAPGHYRFEIKKDGFAPWEKLLRIDAETVTRAWATLFPTVPSLRALTFSGAHHPLISPDGGKIVYVLTTTKTSSQIYSIDLSESPLGALNRESRLIGNIPLAISTSRQFTWSPDSKQVLVSATPSAYLLDITTQTKVSQIPNPQPLLDSWSQTSVIREAQKFATLPPRLQEILATSSANFLWSPNENKLLYTATASAVLADNLIRQLPGSSTQPQNRALAPGKVYVYDLEEDRNFAVGEAIIPTPTPKPQKNLKNSKSKPIEDLSLDIGHSNPLGLSWFPTSAHLIKTEPDKITIFEYDGQNPVTVYAGPMAGPLAAPYPSGRQLVILTNLNPTSSTLPNLYALSLK